MGRRRLSRQTSRLPKPRGLLLDDASQRRRLRWQDAISLLAVPLAIAGLRAEDTALIAACFMLSAGVLSFSVATSDQINVKFRGLIITVIIVIFGGLTVYIRNENLIKELAANEGLLEPGDKRSPKIPASCGAAVPENAVLFFFGSNLDWSTDRPHAAISVGQELLSISVRKDGNASIDHLTIFDDRDNVIANIEQNKLWVELGTRQYRPDKSTLSVKDHLNKEVVKIEFLNPRSIRLSGVFRYPGAPPIVITDDLANIRGMQISGSCSARNGTGFLIN
jgi:hypothetical protein